MRLLAVVAVVGCAVGCSSGTALGEGCGALKGLALEGGVITRAEAVVSGTVTTPYGDTIGELPAFCRVVGELTPTVDSVIRFEVWMPIDTQKTGDPKAAAWNGRLLGVGNGGFAGSIGYRQMAGALRLGYATTGTDTGHEGEAQDASWAYRHPEKIVDYGYRGVHLMTVRAKTVVAAMYGKAQDHAYFDACSDGGREALMEAQRFPEDYDGILAGAPANNWTRLVTGSLGVTQTMSGDPVAYLSSIKLPAINRASLAACDALDGVEDGIVSAPERCRFDPAVLLCTGKEYPGCLTGPQVKTLKAIYAEKTDRAGATIFPGLVPGAEWPAWRSWITGEGPGGGAAYAANYFRYMVTNDPGWDVQKADAGESLKQAQAATAVALDAVDPDLSRFAAHGGKLMMYHGWNDPAISPWNSIAYAKSVRETMGAAKADGAVRLYMVPGMEHCAGGPGPSSFGQLGLPGARGAGSGMLDALEGWVEKGTAPGTILTAKFSATGKATMVRPLCAYPQAAVYDGKGDANVPESFACVAPSEGTAKMR